MATPFYVSLRELKNENDVTKVKSPEKDPLDVEFEPATATKSGRDLKKWILNNHRNYYSMSDQEKTWRTENIILYSRSGEGEEGKWDRLDGPRVDLINGRCYGFVDITESAPGATGWQLRSSSEAGPSTGTKRKIFSQEIVSEDAPPKKKGRFDVLREISSSPPGSSVRLTTDENNLSFNLITHSLEAEMESITQFYIPQRYKKILTLILQGNEEKDDERKWFKDRHMYRFILGTKGVGISCCLTFICSMLLKLMDDTPKTVESLFDNQVAYASSTTDTNNRGGTGNCSPVKMNNQNQSILENENNKITATADGNGNDGEGANPSRYQQRKVNKILFVSCTDKMYEFFYRTEDGGFVSEMGKYRGQIEDLAEALNFEYSVEPVVEILERTQRNWLLLDPQGERNPLEQSWESNVVIATSMDENTKIASIASTHFPRMYYLGAYSMDEYKYLIKKSAGGMADDKDILRCWNRYGGIPRHYFKREYEVAQYEKVHEKLMTLLRSNGGFDLVDSMDLFGKTASKEYESSPKTKAGMKLLNMVIHMIPDDSLTRFSLKVVNELWLKQLRIEFKREEYTKHKNTFHILYNRQNIHEVHDQIVAEAPLFDVPRFYTKNVSVTAGNNPRLRWEAAKQVIAPQSTWQTVEEEDIFEYLPEYDVCDPVQRSIKFRDKLSRLVKVFKCSDGNASYDQVYLFINSARKRAAYLINSTCQRPSSKPGNQSHSLILSELFQAIAKLKPHYDDIKYVMAVRNEQEARQFTLERPKEVEKLANTPRMDKHTELNKWHGEFKKVFPKAKSMDLTKPNRAIKCMAEHLINDYLYIMAYVQED